MERSKIFEKLLVIFATVFVCVSNVIEIDSLGKVSHLGYCYDARSMKFLHYSIFKVPLDNLYIQNDTFGTTESKAYKGLKYQERVSHFSFSSQMSLYLALGMLDANGAAKGVTDAIGKTQLRGGSFMQTSRTEKYWIHLPDSRLTQFISMISLNRSSCTHVITGIQYAIRTCYNYFEGEITEESEQSGESTIEAATNLWNAEIKAGGSWSTRLLNYLKSYTWEFFSDVIFVGPPPSSWEQVDIHMKDVAEKAKNYKGMPLIYYGTPVAEFRDLFLERRNDEVVRDIENDLSDAIGDVTISLHDVERKLIAYRKTLLSYLEIIPRSDLTLITNYINSWILTMKFYIQSTVDSINSFKNCTVDCTIYNIMSRLNDLKEHYDIFSNYPVEWKFRKEVPQVDESIQRYNYLRSLGVNLINSTVTINRLATRRESFVVLYFRKQWIKEDKKEWENVLSIFTGYKEMWSWFNEHPKFMVDCDLWGDQCNGITNFTFHKWNKGIQVGQTDYMCDISKSFQNEVSEWGDYCDFFFTPFILGLN